MCAAMQAEMERLRQAAADQAKEAVAAEAFAGNPAGGDTTEGVAKTAEGTASGGMEVDKQEEEELAAIKAALEAAAAVVAGGNAGEGTSLAVAELGKRLAGATEAIDKRAGKKPKQRGSSS